LTCVKVEPSGASQNAVVSPRVGRRKIQRAHGTRSGCVWLGAFERFLLCCLLTFILAWPALAADGFTSLFNSRDLTGWDGQPGWWRVEDGTITAESTAEKPCAKHNYLIWRGGEPADFELRFEYRITGGNSGVQFRSREVPDWDMRGYQADIEDGPQWTGALFEHERGGIALRGE
jgi:hypothetical protein